MNTFNVEVGTILTNAGIVVAYEPSDQWGGRVILAVMPRDEYASWYADRQGFLYGGKYHATTVSALQAFAHRTDGAVTIADGLPPVADYSRIADALSRGTCQLCGFESAPYRRAGDVYQCDGDCLAYQREELEQWATNHYVMS